MKTIEIEERNKLISSLLNDSFWDSFFVYELKIETVYHIEISGKFNDEYLEEDDDTAEEKNAGYVKWGRVKKIFWQILSENKKLRAFNASFIASDEISQYFIGKLNVSEEKIQNLVLTIHYEHGKLYILTGITTGDFLLGQTLDADWNTVIKMFLKKKEIV